MKINEFCSPLICYLASVRVVLPHTSMNSRMMINAESASQAFAILTRTYGVGNVYSINQFVNESSRTCPIQQEAVIQDQSVQTEQQVPRVAHVQISQVLQPKQPQTRKVSARPIPYQVKHLKFDTCSIIFHSLFTKKTCGINMLANVDP